MGSSLFARHYSGSRGFFPFLWVLRCFSSPACLLVPYVFRYGYPRITTGEFPHSEILGSMTGQRLPQAYRSRPRPSSALSAKASTVCPCSLDQKNTGNRCRYGVFKVHASSIPALHRDAARLMVARSLKTQQRTLNSDRRGRRNFQASWRVLTVVETIEGVSAYRSKSSGFPRKEVIQPQLPLRLPCYDFTPIINPTFDGSLPCGLGHRLRVLPTFVV